MARSVFDPDLVERLKLQPWFAEIEQQLAQDEHGVMRLSSSAQRSESPVAVHVHGSLPSSVRGTKQNNKLIAAPQHHFMVRCT